MSGLPTLTLHQPWASLIAEGVKTIETRSWKAPDKLIGQTVGIHAGKTKADVMKTGWGPWLPLNDPERPGMLRSDIAPLPLGAIVATARLISCLPMMFDGDGAHHRGAPHLCVHGDDLAATYDTGDQFISDVSDQLPYGDFAPGRWAWMLDDIKPTTERCPWCLAAQGPGLTACPVCDDQCTCDPVPAKGAQRVWYWTPEADR